MRANHNIVTEELTSRSERQRRESFNMALIETRQILSNPNHIYLKQTLIEPKPRLIRNWIELPLPPKPEIRTQIEVLNSDCVEVATKLQMRGYNPLLLITSSSPEEAKIREDLTHNISRRSDFERHQNYLRNPGPIPPRGGIYYPKILFFRGSEAENFPILNEYKQRYLDCIVVESLTQLETSPRKGDFSLSTAATELLQEKIKLIFSVASWFGHDSVVLTTLGCGNNRNPPNEVALNFRRVLQTEEFHNRFSRVVFGIHDDENTQKAHNPLGNVRPFSEVFQVRVKSIKDLV